MTNERDAILTHLGGFIRQRAGLEFGNYGDLAVYRSEQRSITRDLHDARELLTAVSLRSSITAEMLRESFRAYSGRLSWHRAGEPCDTCKGKGTISANYSDPTQRRVCYSCKGSKVNAKDSLDYCAGQYFPTEYRKAVCAVLAQALWDYWAGIHTDTCKAQPERCKTARRIHAHGFGGYDVDTLDGLSAGEWIRKQARRELSTGVARRWFN